MLWKYIVVIGLIVLISLFMGFNLENKTNISFIFGTVTQVPVFYIILISFAVGVFSVVPFSLLGKLRSMLKKNKKKKADEKELKKETEEKEVEETETSNKKEGRRGKKK
ncbi:MAG: DUF1049 domain-containing protein [Spirochaetaceae bacterium]|nr:MAG: DUF1049 domain-containing protein [Spirochaetaceae bacterium]